MVFSLLKPSQPVPSKPGIQNPVFQIRSKKSSASDQKKFLKAAKAHQDEKSYRAFWFYLPIGLLMALTFYGFWTEPYWIQVSRYTVDAGLSQPLKVAHIADLHTYGLGSREQEVLSLIDKEQPDLIAITGDSLSDSGTYEMCRPVLAKLHAPLGVWAVPGNYENARRPDNETAYYGSLNIHYLVNGSQSLRPDLFIAGLDDPPTGHPSLDAALAFVPPKAFTLVLLHSPAYFPKLAGHCNLVLAGHSHGGQLHLPILERLWLPTGVDDYVAGWFEKKGTRMFVSRGLGTVTLDIRLFCRPELAFITLN
jgi:uncharacterized protein